MSAPNTVVSQQGYGDVLIAAQEAATDKGNERFGLSTSKVAYDQNDLFLFASFVSAQPTAGVLDSLVTLPLSLKWQVRFGQKTSAANTFGKLWLSMNVGLSDANAWNTYVCPFTSSLTAAGTGLAYTNTAVQADPTNWASVPAGQAITGATAPTGAVPAATDGVTQLTCTGALAPTTDSKQLNVGDTVKYRVGYAGWNNQANGAPIQVNTNPSTEYTFTVLEGATTLAAGVAAYAVYSLTY